MKWLAIAIAALVGLVLACVAIGAALPRSHRARRSVVLDAAPEVVFAALTDTAAFPTWRTGLDLVELLPSDAGHRSYREHTSDGAIAYVVDEEVAPARLVTRIADPTLPFGGRWIYQLAPQGKGTRLTITEEGEVYNPLFRFMSRFVFGHPATIEKFLRALGKRFGQEVMPAEEL